MVGAPRIAEAGIDSQQSVPGHLRIIDTTAGISNRRRTGDAAYPLVDGTSTAAEIARAVGADESVVIKTLAGLSEAGVLEILGVVEVMPDHTNEPTPSTLDGRFFSTVELELARAIGPLAPIVVDDELAAMGEGRAGFNRGRAAELVERVSLAIRDESRRVKFQSAMLPEIRRL